MSEATTTPVSASAFGCITVPFLLIALVPLAWGARANWQNGELARHGDVVPGRVVEVRYVETNSSVAQQGTRGGNARGAAPIVTFTTREGDVRTATGSVNRNPAPWTVGDTVDVVYDPTDPARADLRSEVAGWRLWFVIWCAVAVLPAAVAFAPVVLFLRSRRPT